MDQTGSNNGSLSNRIGGDFERHIHFGECAFCLLMN